MLDHVFQNAKDVISLRGVQDGAGCLAVQLAGMVVVATVCRSTPQLT